MEKEIFTYIMFDGILYKIGKSINPEKRLNQIKTSNPNAKLICYGNAVTEKYMHDRFYRSRVKGEWFKLNEEQLRNAIRLIKNGENNLLANYDNEVQKMIEGSLKSDKLSEKYIIEFGKYKGTPIKEMLSAEQYQYCNWLYNEMKRKMTRYEKKHSRKYKAFYWLLQNINRLNKELEKDE